MTCDPVLSAPISDSTDGVLTFRTSVLQGAEPRGKLRSPGRAWVLLPCITTTSGVVEAAGSQDIEQRMVWPVGAGRAGRWVICVAFRNTSFEEGGLGLFRVRRVHHPVFVLKQSHRQ